MECNDCEIKDSCRLSRNGGTCTHPLFGDSNKSRNIKKGNIVWRKAKAGHNFGKDTVVLYNGDPDARLVRCAIYDCIYIHVEDLLKLPKE